jgi:hypothetical protein
MSKVSILVPHRSEFDYRSWRDWFKGHLQCPPGTEIQEARGMALCTLRTALVEAGLRSGAEWLFLLDDDVIGPDEGLLTLLAAAEQNKWKFMSGLYWARKNQKDRSLSAWRLFKQKSGNEAWAKDQTVPSAISDKQDGRFVSVDAVGLGFSLIHRSVFENISRPWFDWPVNGPSEDFYFCEKVARELKITPVVDMEIKCGHIGTFIILPDGTFDMLNL